jgi:hypothetical protein
MIGPTDCCVDAAAVVSNSLVPRVSILAARADCFLRKLLLIVQGLMWGEGYGDRFFVTAPLWASSLGVFATVPGRGVFLSGSRFRLLASPSFLRLAEKAGVISSKGPSFPVGAAAVPSRIMSCA